MTNYKNKYKFYKYQNNYLCELYENMTNYKNKYKKVL